MLGFFKSVEKTENGSYNYKVLEVAQANTLPVMVNAVGRMLGPYEAEIYSTANHMVLNDLLMVNPSLERLGDFV